MVETQDHGPYYRISDTKNPDLLRERQSATFDAEQLTQFMFGGSHAYFDINQRRQITRLAYSHPIHETHLPLEYLDADEYYSLLIRKSFIAIREAERLKITNMRLLNWYLTTFTNGRFVFGLHTSMFINTLETMASEEQQKKFLPLAYSFRIIGTYAQTELGHGSNLQRLESEAVFDRKTDSFIMNTPTLTATKFWPGALGRSSNYVLMMAQLFTPDRTQPCGLQMFFVQIRDLDTHEPLPGKAFDPLSTGMVFDDWWSRSGSGRNQHALRSRGRWQWIFATEQCAHSSQPHADEIGPRKDRLSQDRFSFRLSRLMNRAISIVWAILDFSMVLCWRRVYSFLGCSPRYWLVLWPLPYDTPLSGTKDWIPAGRISCLSMAKDAGSIQMVASFFLLTRKENAVLDYPLQQEKLVPCVATTYAFFASFIKLESLRVHILASENILFERLPEVGELFSKLPIIILVVLAACCVLGSQGILVDDLWTIIANMPSRMRRTWLSRRQWNQGRE